MSGLEWREPPKRQERTDWSATIAELKANPGQWAVVGTYKNKNTARSVWDKQKALFDGRFEFAATAREDGTGELYLRYMGESA